MKIIGLTGPTGSGKSTVANEALNLGFAVIDADKVAKFVVENEKTVLDDLEACFGSDIFDKNGKLDRKALAAKAFLDAKNTQKLNEITLPTIVKNIEGKINEYKTKGAKAVLLDAPTLFESGADKICDSVIAVLADKDVRKSRIIARDNLTIEQAEVRLAASKSDDFYKQRTKHILYNIGDISQFCEKAVALLEQLVV